MVRNWGDVREVLEDIERDRLEEKLKKKVLKSDYTISSIRWLKKLKLP